MESDIPILLVEDNNIDIQNVQRAFKRQNVKNPLHIVHNGKEALEYLSGDEDGKNKSKSLPGVILLDLEMPIMNGKELLKAIKADSALRKIPVVVFTTSSAKGDIEDSYQHFAAGYIVKPVRFSDFVEVVGQFGAYWNQNTTPADI
ncbi:MAG: response regulator [Nitrospinota bacterium]|nr:response regulator [Nitrospinota bacterium]